MHFKLLSIFLALVTFLCQLQKSQSHQQHQHSSSLSPSHCGSTMSNPAGLLLNPFHLDNTSYHSESTHSFHQQQLNSDLEVPFNLNDGLLSLFNSYEDPYQARPAFDFSLQPHNLLILPDSAASRPQVISTLTNVLQPADRMTAPQLKIKWSKCRVCLLVKYICKNPK